MYLLNVCILGSDKKQAAKEYFVRILSLSTGTIQQDTKVDGQCDKLATDDRRQFITLTVHLS